MFGSLSALRNRYEFRGKSNLRSNDQLGPDGRMEVWLKLLHAFWAFGGLYFLTPLP